MGGEPRWKVWAVTAVVARGNVCAESRFRQAVAKGVGGSFKLGIFALP